MRALPLLLVAGLGACFLMGCGPEPPCPEEGSADQGSAAAAGPLYIGAGDPYAVGPLDVRTLDIERCEAGSPLPLQIHAPQQAGTYAVVLFQHGFLLKSAYYSEVLRHVASHGFVIVAPQMYPADGWPLGKPTTQQEADSVIKLLYWLEKNLSSLAGVTADMQQLGIAGHSRGGKVAWRVLLVDAGRFKAVAGVDPTDGTFDGTGRVTEQPFPFSLPSLVIGAGLGSTPLLPCGLSCSPAGDNHESFYQASGSPAWHVVAVEAGHLDLLNDEHSDCGLTCLVCSSGPDPAGVRRLIAGLLTAFFRGTLQGDVETLAILTDAGIAPSPIVAAYR